MSERRMCSVATYFRYSSKRTWRQISQPIIGLATATFLRVCSSSFESIHFNSITYSTEIPTFIVAGHETTAAATSWALYALAQYPAVQKKLRTELLTLCSDNPSMEDLQALPYLDMVVKEVLRHHAPVPAAVREAVEDDVIPLDKPFIDRNGNICNEIQ